MPAHEGNNYAAGNPGGARPTDYKPEFASIAAKMCELGATDQELADAFDVSVRTIYNWKYAHQEFFAAIALGKSTADDRVERSLYQRAVGYEQEEVKIFMPSGAASPVYAPYRAKVAADVGAAKLWLTNRRGDKWRDKAELTGADGAPLIPDVSDTDLARLTAFLLTKAARDQPTIQ